MVFRNFYDSVYGSGKSERYNLNSGSKLVPLYAAAFNDDGRIDLVEAGKHDLYSEIQSHKESVDINVILSRFQNGDAAVLNRSQGLYLDVTEFPKTYAEMYQRVIDAENYFDSLPIDVRKRFNFSSEEFFASIGTDRFNEVFGISKVESEPLEGTLDKIDDITSTGGVVNEPQPE